MAGGRPTDYSEELARAICDRMASGESVVKICRDEHMPSTSTIINWKMKYPEFLANYEQAKELCSEHYASEIIEIAKDRDASIPDRRIEIDAIKWTSGRMRLKPRAEVEKSQPTTDDDFEAKKEEILEALREELGK